MVNRVSKFVSNQPVPFELIAGDTALDFVNTLDDRFAQSGPKDLLKSYGDLLRFMEQAQLLTPRESQMLSLFAPAEEGKEALSMARAFREALAEVLYRVVDGVGPAPKLVKARGEKRGRAEFPGPAKLDWLNRIMQAALAARNLDWQHERGASRLLWTWPKLDPSRSVLKLAIAAVELLSTDRFGAVRACDDPACRWLFLDTSKNHTRRWCNMKVCGNRMKARRFKGAARLTRRTTD